VVGMAKRKVPPGDEEEGLGLLEDGGLGSDYVHVEDERSGFGSICCCVRRHAADFTEEDKDVLWQFRRRIVNSPRPEDDKLQELFLGIWNSAYPEEQITSFEVSDRWKRLGFQGKNPTTDIRTGAFPVEQLANFSRQHPKLFRDMITEADSKDFDYPFAITCFNVSHMLAIFFDLVTCFRVQSKRTVSRCGHLSARFG